MNGKHLYAMETTVITDHSYSVPFTRIDELQNQALQNQVFQNNDVHNGDDHEDARKHLKRKVSLPPTSSDDDFSKRQYQTSVINSDDKVEYAIPNENNLPINDGALVITPNNSNLSEDDAALQTLCSDDNIAPETQFESSIYQKECYGINYHNNNSITHQQRIQLSSIYHAYHCNKLEKKSCPEAFCKDPTEIIKVVDYNLSQVFVKAIEGNIRRESIDETYKIIVFHARQCSDRSNCCMPLCKEYKNSLEKLFQSDERTKEYTIFDPSKKSEKTICEGEDFIILHEVNIDKGMFGRVSWCAMKNRNGEKFATVIKRIQFDQNISQALAISLPALEKFRNHQNICVPDLVVYNKREVCLFMERADLSLFQYMQTYNGGMPANAVTFYIFQMAKALKKIHKCDHTHGDVKVSNCLLFENCLILKLSDLDSLKPISMRLMSGSPYYVDPRILESGNVDKPSDIYSLCQCIAVLLFGSKRVIQEYTPEQIYELIRKIDVDLADIYRFGTMIEVENRITADQIVAWFRQNVNLKARCTNFRPNPTPSSILPGKTLCDHVVEGYFASMIKELPSRFNLVL